MKEITGNLWDHYGKRHTVVCLTTNGFVKRNGEAVMGRGCAYEATQRVPGIARQLGRKIQAIGNQPVFLDEFRILAFPVKHHWREAADLKLIESSAFTLLIIASSDVYAHCTFVLPRPGCGNGRLNWADVKPLLTKLPDNVWVITHA